jgi:hypothetical protein
MAVHDPTGTYRAQVDEIARKVRGEAPDPMKSATASLGGELAEGAGTAMSRAVPDVAPSLMKAPSGATPFAGAAAEAAPTAGDAASDTARILGKYAMKTGDGGAPDAAPPVAPMSAQPPAPQAPPMAAPAKPPGLVVTGQNSSWQRTKNEQRQTTGLAEEDKAKVDAANESAISASDKANTEDFAAKATQFWHEFGRLSEQEKRQIAQRATLQEQERRYDESLNGAYKKLDETAARPIDPSQAFAGEKGWYAFMAGFGDVLRNVGAALAGQRPVADPGATLDQLVERSVNLQMAQKKADYEAGRIGVDRLTADRETTRHRLGVVLTQLADTQLQKAHTEQEYQALGALRAKGEAIVADARAKAAAATARQETTGYTTSDVSGGTVTKGIPKPTSGLDQINTMLDIEKKRLELSNAALDQQDAQSVSATIGKQVSPERAKQLRDGIKGINPQMAKLDSTMQALKAQLEINGATFDRNTGKVTWPKDVSGVSTIRWTDIPVPGGENITTDASRLDKQQAFLKELVTTDTTGAVASAEQMPAFQQVVGGTKHNETQYKESVENFAKYLVERRNGYLAPLGEDGIRLYRHVEQGARQGLAPSAKPIGTLPEGRR